ncbi:MAG: terminase TerL endonuclease subunit [Gammaproteobacteria bacterium]|nr:terminase TerL endonuclease subunit [Gammaproteobacteria bacterium]
MTRKRRKGASATPRGPSRGERNCAWIEKYCRVPEGRFVGQPVKLRPWQRRIVCGIYDNPAGTRRGIISFGRKNAKTTLAAFLLLLHLCGPEARQNSQLYSTALSRDQAAITFRLAALVIRQSPLLRAYVEIRETAKQLLCRDLGTLYAALSAESSTAMGLSPVFIVHDELGQVKGPRHPLYEALETATAAQEAPLSIVISTQAPTDNDLLSILIDDAQASHDPKVLLFLYTADPEADPFAEETIRQANPAFGDFQNAEEVMAMAEDARRMPSREAEYRNLILNQRVEAASPFITKSVWDLNAAEPGKMLELFGGLDLSETSDLTSLVMTSPDRNHLNVYPTFWLPKEGIEERSRADRVPYDVWAKNGYIDLTPGRSVEYEYVAGAIAVYFREQRVRKIAFDRYNMRHLTPWLIKAGISQAMIDARFEPFGQGFVSMSPALRVTESMLLNGRMRHGNHPVLTMCAANAVVETDAAGNRKLTKKKSRGRIDGMTALVQAAAMASAEMNQERVYPVELESILEG